MCEPNDPIDSPERRQAVPVSATPDPDEFPPDWTDFTEARRRALERLRSVESPAWR